jgi:hypothetical protein
MKWREARPPPNTLNDWQSMNCSLRTILTTPEQKSKLNIWLDIIQQHKCCTHLQNTSMSLRRKSGDEENAKRSCMTMLGKRGEWGNKKKGN